jgi:alcohol dehydrogenase
VPGIRAVEVAEAGGPLRVVERELPVPGPGEVRVAVEASGICHTDVAVINGWLPGTAFPLVPGHEIAGRVDAVGDGVTGWRVGQRVGVGWFGGTCGRCALCREGDFINCTALKIPGLAYPGGYADAVVVPADALAAIPDALSSVEAAPLMCAGVTTYNALRTSAARPGDLVAILGLGGLGHLGVQYADRLGFEVVAISRGREKEAAARELGARHYIDSTAQDVAEALSALGGARVVVATATESAAIAATVDGLAPRGQLVVAGAPGEPLPITPLQLIFGSHQVIGHASGTARDSERALEFSALTGVRPRVEELALEQAAEGYARMVDGAARFRIVLTT